MIRRLLRRWIGEPTPEDGLAETLAITIRCARRCAYDLSHAADMIDPRMGREWEQRFQDKANHWQSLFSSGTSTKDYRLRLHSELDQANRTIEKLRERLKAAGLPAYDDHEMPF